MIPSVTFHGAAGTVTGSCTLIRHDGGTLLIDCGLFQGPKTVKELNYRDFPFDPREPAALVLTHAHIDHSGLVPKLCRQGFKGRIHCTSGTRDLLTFMLPDSGFIQESEVQHLNQRNRQRGRAEVQPIYTRKDAEACLDQLEPADYGTWIDVMPGAKIRFWDAGHLLGSASVEVRVAGDGGEQTLLFSGDLGPGDKPFHGLPEGPAGADWVFCESTYGATVRPPVDNQERRRQLGVEVAEALKSGGVLLIPVFAVERTQELLYDLNQLIDDGTLPRTDIFLDSPLAVNVTDVFRRHLPDINHAGVATPFDRPYFHPITEVEGSKRLNRLGGGAIIMAASGMCDAGRIRHHLKNHLWQRNATVLFVGYQAPGTLGRLLVQGRSPVRIHGEEVEVRARIRTLDSYSGHADQAELLAWLAARGPIRGGVALMHGETAPRQALADALAASGLAVPIHQPALDETIVLRPGKAERVPAAQPRLVTVPDEDWHNLYARTVLDLSERLRHGDDAERLALLREVAALLTPPEAAPRKTAPQETDR
ncbi:MBL fold metallo-hydrolase [Nitrospirillum sp. BR 11752]|uniref:MBL fold metallo-hydrolase n=1 Tax=Nitrospirillum sp. BR 11752 TaxID=3104293 RepID=UPI002EA67EDA|nr:MBL fold metallo-hydrolase [Nitrospirillum sp. BR 11752]